MLLGYSTPVTQASTGLTTTATINTSLAYLKDGRPGALCELVIGGTSNQLFASFADPIRCRVIALINVSFAVGASVTATFRIGGGGYGTDSQVSQVVETASGTSPVSVLCCQTVRIPLARSGRLMPWITASDRLGRQVQAISTKTCRCLVRSIKHRQCQDGPCLLSLHRVAMTTTLWSSGRHSWQSQTIRASLLCLIMQARARLNPLGCMLGLQLSAT